MAIQILATNTFRLKSAKRQSGQGMSEYLIMLALIVVAAIALFGYFGQTVEYQMAGMAQSLAGVDPTGANSDAQSTGNAALKFAGKAANTMDNYDESASRGLGGGG